MMQWYGREFEVKLRKHLTQNLTGAAIETKNQLKQTLSKQGRVNFDGQRKGHRKAAGQTVMAIHNRQRGRALRLAGENRGQVGRYKVRFGKRGANGTRRALGLFRRSRPGEAPYMQTGRLRNSIAYELDHGRLVARIGTNVRYGLMLELGTRRVAARPWFKVTINRIRAIVTRWMTRPMP